MKKSRFSEEKIIAVLKQADAGVKVAELVRKNGISEATWHTPPRRPANVPVVVRSGWRRSCQSVICSGRFFLFGTRLHIH